MKIRVLTVAGLFPVLMSGCVTVMMEVGRKPPTDRLETMLEVGRTNRGHVLEILGPPDGVGQANLIFHPEPRILWQYLHSYSVCL